MNVLVRSVCCVIIFVIYQNSKCFALKWGCPYSDYAQFSHTREILEANDNLIWGNTIIPAAQIDDRYDLELLLGKIQLMLQAVVSVCTYNSFENIIKFYETVSRQFRVRHRRWTLPFRLHLFINKFKYYTPIYSDDSWIALVAKILWLLTLERPEFNDNVFLATVYAGASDEYALTEQTTMDIDNTFVHNHVAAILKICYNNTYGYIVMDPVRGLVNPILIMEEDYFYTANNQRGDIFFRMLPSYGITGYDELIMFSPYIIQSHNLYESFPSDNHLYYIRRPFCSMVYITYKYDLLKPLRSLDKLDQNAHFIARIETDITQSINGTGSVAVFTVYTTREMLVVEFNRWARADVRRHVDRILSDAGAANMGYPDQDNYYKDKITNIGTIINDKHFIGLYMQFIQNPVV